MGDPALPGAVLRLPAVYSVLPCRGSYTKGTVLTSHHDSFGRWRGTARDDQCVQPLDEGRPEGEGERATDEWVGQLLSTFAARRPVLMARLYYDAASIRRALKSRGRHDERVGLRGLHAPLPRPSRPGAGTPLVAGPRRGAGGSRRHTPRG